jgi:pimeloyl-ACP methyl ester carboxylesterase
VSIAYRALGEGGTPLVLQSPVVFGHIGLEWENTELQNWYRRLAERRTIVRYDRRNNGLSDRSVANLSLAALVSDIEAVVDRLGLERLALMGFGGDAPAALAYAAQFPSRVSRLLVSNGVARLAAIWERPEFQHVLPLAETDWRLFTETLAHVTFGWRGGRAAHSWARFIRRSVTQEDYRRQPGEDLDVSPPAGPYRIANADHARENLPCRVCAAARFRHPERSSCPALGSPVPRCGRHPSYRRVPGRRRGTDAARGSSALRYSHHPVR